MQVLRWQADIDDCVSQVIVHRDIKPGNIMTRNGHDPVLVDLGYAKRLASATRSRVVCQHMQTKDLNAERSKLPRS